MSISAPCRTSSKRVDFCLRRPWRGLLRFGLRTSSLLGLGVFCCACTPPARLAAGSDLIFVGDSITAAGPWVAAFPNRRVVNAAVPGYTSVDMLAQLPSLRRDQPHTYVLMAGINDLRHGAKAESVAQRLALIRQALATPGQRLIQVSTLPCQIRSCGAAALAEVAQLLEQPIKSLEGRRDAWRWRDWQVQPSGDGRWRLAREASGSDQAARNRDG